MNNIDPELYCLFPTTVMKFHMGREFSTIEKLYVEKQISNTMRNNHGNSITENHSVLHDPAMLDLTDWINKCLDIYVKDTLCIIGIEPYITESWINVANKGEFHNKHIHSNSFLSGVLYYQTKETDRIIFSKNGSMFHNMNWSFNLSSYNVHNSITWWIPSTQYTLLIFPSTLEHEVPVNENDDYRISLSFNTFFKGRMGGIYQANNLSLL